MKKLIGFAFALVITSNIGLVACAEFKSAGRDIGHATRDVTKDVGRSARGAVKSTGKAVGDAIR